MKIIIQLKLLIAELSFSIRFQTLVSQIDAQGVSYDYERKKNKKKGNKGNKGKF